MMMKNKSYVISIFLLFGIFGCDPIQSQHISEDCPVNNFDHKNIRACGYLEVPESRSAKHGKKIKIAYSVIKSKSSHPLADPVVYLMGGPGGSSLKSIRFWARHPILIDRDLILVDQRGTGYSRPALCPELGFDMADVLSKDLNSAEELEAIKASTVACKTKLLAQGINLGAYNSKENAADLEALRKHLGYKQWNVYGGSYGTRLALTIMRDFPSTVRSAVLSGPFPPQANMYQQLIPNFKQALEALFEHCEAVPTCHKKYPNLRQEFVDLMSSLRKKAVKASYQGKPFYINAQDALLIIHQLLYSRNTAGRIPSFIKGLRDGHQDDINRALVPLLQRAGAIDFAMYYSVQAYEEYPFNGKEVYEQSLKDHPQYASGLAFLNADVEILPTWHGIQAPELENEMVRSNIPTLIMVGKLDPITPVLFARQAAEGLTQSELVVFPGMSHNLLGYCPNKILLSFINNPNIKPNSECRLENNFLIFD